MTLEKLVLATNNLDKAREVRAILGDSVEIVTAREVGVELIDVAEVSDTFEGNALIKAYGLLARCGDQLMAQLGGAFGILAEDSGIIVPGLSGQMGLSEFPGVRSKRWFPDGDDTARNAALLKLVRQHNCATNAMFVSAIAVVGPTVSWANRGTCSGTLVDPRGGDGFGYDPIFEPEGSNLTFAEMSAEAKNAGSHRRLALQHLQEWLHEKGQIT